MNLADGFAEGDLAATVTHAEPVIERPYVDSPEPQPFQWTYDREDPALMLFTAAVERFGMKFRRGSKVLELGCSETDWLERMARTQQDFDLVGVDTRPESHRAHDGFRLMRGNAIDPDLFPPASFDCVVMLGALEHFGLGYYGDPVDEWGDTKTMRNVATWLKPDGCVYFDVPVQPIYRVAENRHFRMYAADNYFSGSISERLIPLGLREVNRGYSLPEPHAGTWCHQPTTDRVPYWYCAVLAQKC